MTSHRSKLSVSNWSYESKGQNVDKWLTGKIKFHCQNLRSISFIIFCLYRLCFQGFVLLFCCTLYLINVKSFKENDLFKGSSLLFTTNLQVTFLSILVYFLFHSNKFRVSFYFYPSKKYMSYFYFWKSLFTILNYFFHMKFNKSDILLDIRLFWFYENLYSA